MNAETFPETIEIEITQDDYDKCKPYTDNQDCLLATACKHVFELDGGINAGSSTIHINNLEVDVMYGIGREQSNTIQNVYLYLQDRPIKKHNNQLKLPEYFLWFSNTLVW